MIGLTLVMEEGHKPSAASVSFEGEGGGREGGHLPVETAREKETT